MNDTVASVVKNGAGEHKTLSRVTLLTSIVDISMRTYGMLAKARCLFVVKKLPS